MTNLFDDPIFPQVIIHNAIRVTKDAFNVTLDSADCMVLWVTLIHKDEVGEAKLPEPILVVTDLEGNTANDYTVEKQAKFAAMKFRVRQIQKEYGISSSDSVTYPALISKLLERVWSGEWMGQFNNGKAIYFNELADLLNVPVIAVWDLIEDQIALRKADWMPQSSILIAPRGEEPVKWTSEIHGHKELSLSDFGYWGCNACGKTGDDYSNPQDFTCS